MPHDLSHAKVWKHARGTSRRLLIVSTPIHWSQHWIDGRSYICPQEDCIACTAWLPTQHVGALAMAKRTGDPVWIQTAAHAWRSPLEGIIGTVVTVTRPDTVTKVDGSEPGPKDQQTFTARESWSVIACMNRLPLPDIALQDALVDLRNAAAKQLRAVLPILAQEDDA